VRPWIATLPLAAAATVIAQRSLSWWTIEDAAISFAFARNWAAGAGLVAFPGGERVEGYSNFTWVALLAGFELLGVDGFTSSKWLGAALAAVAVVAIGWLGKQLSPVVGALAACMLAVDATFVIWSTSGLENALFAAALATGLARLVVEQRDGGHPWSVLPFLILAATRPEAPLYVAWAVVWRCWTDVNQGRGLRSTLRWAVLFAVPFAAYHGLRFAYFAQELPATYHAKLGATGWRPMAWEGRGWRYLRRASTELGWGPLAGVLLLGVLGRNRWRAACLGALLFAVVVLAPVWVEVRVAVLFGGAALAGILAGGPVQRLVWGAGCLGLLFSLASTGDWMRGHRWLSLAAVPGALLLAQGAQELRLWVLRLGGDRPVPVPGWIAVGAVLVAHGGAHLSYLAWYTTHTETTPANVMRRVDAYVEAWSRLQMDRRFVAVDHDMGGMTWRAKEHGRVVDAKGLTDLPFALHHGQARVKMAEEYVLGDPPFDLAHAHASTGWVLRRTPRFRKEYVELPGYGTGSELHTANHIRKDLFVSDGWPYAPFTVRFPAGIHLHGVRIPSPEVGPGSGLYAEVGLQQRGRTGAGMFRVLMFLASDDHLVLLDVPPGYDTWYPPSRWKQGEVFIGRYSLPIQEDMPLGSYTVGVVLMGAGGKVLKPLELPEAAELGPPYWVAEGEVRLPGRVQIVDRGTMLELAAADRALALRAAREDRCDEAAGHWERALRHRTRSGDWRRENRPLVARVMAACLSRRAESDDRERSERVRDLVAARTWVPRSAAAQRVGGVLAQAWWAEAMAARERGDVHTAFTVFEAIVRSDPTQSWARRYAEQARAVRLGTGERGEQHEGVER
jgi:hypothetical protein